MPAIRIKLPFGKFPLKHGEDGNEQWQDYCAVTDVWSDRPNDIAIVDLVLTGRTLASLVSDPDIRIANDEDLTEYGIDPNIKRGLA